MSLRERRIPGSNARGCGRRTLGQNVYACLLGLLLGAGHIAHHRHGVMRLTIACRDGRRGPIDVAAGAMAAVKPMSAAGRLQRPGRTIVNSCSEHWGCLFPQHGPGMKRSRALETWQ